MPKIKLPTKSPHIDMTPMVDLFSVILIFLILTATMRQPEPAPVSTPFSISEKPTPDFNTFTVLLSADDKVYINFDNGHDTLLKFRPKILAEMGKRHNIEFNDRELREFEKYPSAIGLPIAQMKEFLNNRDNQIRTKLQVDGVPIDSLNNQLADWVLFARQVNPAVNICIKGDTETGFSTVQRVLDIMQDRNVNKFQLITSLEAAKVNIEEIQQ